MAQQKTAIIIGAGPAGLTTAFELLKTTDVHPVVFEASDDIGGISKTVTYNGNRIDIGGHRFFSKSDTVMDWWNSILPLEKTTNSASESFTLKYQGKTRELTGGADGVDPETTDEVMLVRSRLSRIFYGGKFFNYPITLEATTIKNLGLPRMVKMGFSYIKATIRPIKDEKSLEDFYVNRFGRELYNTFFRDYTEKVWGVPCSEIAPDWGAQRVKGLSVAKTLTHAVKKKFQRKPSTDLAQKGTETSLIEYFLYPKLGPGQMWETVTRKVIEQGGEVHKNKVITKLHAEAGRIVGVDVLDTASGSIELVTGDYFFSTMPVNELISAFEVDGGDTPVPANVREVAKGLPYRDFITVGLLLDKLIIKNTTDKPTKNDIVPDNWIYIQEPDVKVGRLQVFNNWSPYLVGQDDKVWVGMEYFVNEGDELWTKPEDEMAAFGIAELAKIKMIDPADVVDSTVIHIKKTYPAYFGTYSRFDEVREFTDSFENLFLLGRNGQHRYNNQDHSMLTAIAAVENVQAGRLDKKNIWEVNVEQDYHEEKTI
ncbi:NAD(P)/FAD-dependent oxidoreductase [Nakamurella flavida]|uniref:NAD(P)/FAD-dependent oxidoreductase n=1 Tax=Nakamurella flavida TaxID=363630 RepID=A0A938YM22_9ACTN|nr:NAD(P)/FAD-dependent oxidoreductase [Nakamurella flavida]MBM9478507.1 NAD(P)/FAD-dependent oxidoreductase [Nakamurella flavida]MDP9777667.1 protoporphyrinogen oxidase [Nakamurella flavida]